MLPRQGARSDFQHLKLKSSEACNGEIIIEAQRDLAADSFHDSEADCICVGDLLVVELCQPFHRPAVVLERRELDSGQGACEDLLYCNCRRGDTGGEEQETVDFGDDQLASDELDPTTYASLEQGVGVVVMLIVGAEQRDERAAIDEDARGRHDRTVRPFSAT